MTINGVLLAPKGPTKVADFKNNKLDINAEKTPNGFSISSLQQGNINAGDIGTANTIVEQWMQESLKNSVLEETKKPMFGEG